MRTQVTKRSAIIGCTLLCAVWPHTSQADLTVHSGWDLLVTIPEGSLFLGQNWQGVPLVSYDFGGAVGVQSVGGTDTIVHRLADANAPLDTIPIQMSALQLRSVSPFDLGAGLDYHYITLQSVRGGPATTGDMTLDWEVESFFDVWTEISLNYDVRFGSLDGPILASDSCVLTSSVNLWSSDAPPQAFPLIDGVNYRLNGVDTTEDFWPQGLIVESFALGQHTVTIAPEPATGALLLLGGLTLLWQRQRCVSVRATRRPCS